MSGNEDFKEGEEPPVPPPPPPLPFSPPTVDHKIIPKISSNFEPLRIHFAINVENYEELSRQLKRDLNVDFMNYGYTPLMIATLRNQLKSVELLLQHGAKTEIVTGKRFGARAIHFACQVGNLKIVKVLQDYDADLNVQDEDGATPLHWACYYGKADVVQFLENFVEINCIDSRKRTPIFNAIEKGSVEIVESLLIKRAKINIEDIIGWSPLMLACVYGDVDIVRVLLHSGANVLRSGTQNNILFAAITSVSTHHVKTISSAFFKKWMRTRCVTDESLRRAMQNHSPSLTCKKEIISLLLDSGAHFDQIELDCSDFNQLQYFSEGLTNCSDEVWDLLLSAGIIVRLQKLFNGMDAALVLLMMYSSNQAPTDRMQQIINCMEHVQPLTMLCKLSIRTVMQSNINEKISKTALPSKLKKFCLVL